MSHIELCQQCDEQNVSDYSTRFEGIMESCIKCGKLRGLMTLDDYYKRVASEVIDRIRDSFKLDVDSIENEIWRDGNNL